jgi:hypothetical protein
MNDGNCVFKHILQLQSILYVQLSTPQPNHLIIDTGYLHYIMASGPDYVQVGQGNCGPALP